MSADALVYNFLFKFGYQEDTIGSGIAVDSKDRIIVTNIDRLSGNITSEIQVFDNNGELIFEFGSFGSGNGEFNNPQGIATDSKDRIIVADTGNSRVQVFEPAFSYTLMLLEDNNRSDKVIKIGENITAKVLTDDDTINNVIIQWIDPNNDIVREKVIQLVSEEAIDTYAPAIEGKWTILANFSTIIRMDTFIVEKPTPKITSNIDGIDGIYVSNTPYYINGKGNFYICTTTSRTITDIKLVDPINTFNNYNSKLPITLDNQCLNLHTDDFNLSGFNLGGDWALLADTSKVINL